MVLNGTGLTTLTLEPSARDLDAGGNQNVAGQTNARFEFTITNRGPTPATLTLSNEISSATGAAPDRRELLRSVRRAPAPPCPAGPLAAGASCKVDVAMITPAMPVLGRKLMKLQVTGGTA